MTGRISVIIPIYKTEPYLAACLDSVVGQIYEDLEILLVNDGSPDGCAAICDAYAAKDSRIRVIHQEHFGLSAARNAALDVATGDYITFVDSDDFLQEDALERLLATLLKTGADIAVCGTAICSEDGTLLSQTMAQTQQWFYGAAQQRALLIEPTVGTASWGKLYQRSLWKTIRFPEGKYYEDVFIAHEILHVSHATVVCPFVGYWYRQVPTSITHAAFEPRHFHSVEGARVHLRFIRLHYPALAEYAKAALTYTAARCAVRMMESGYSDPVLFLRLQKELRRGAVIFFKKSPCCLRTKLFVAVSAVNLSLAGWLLTHLRKESLQQWKAWFLLLCRRIIAKIISPNPSNLS